MKKSDKKTKYESERIAYVLCSIERNVGYVSCSRGTRNRMFRRLATN